MFTPLSMTSFSWHFSIQQPFVSSITLNYWRRYSFKFQISTASSASTCTPVDSPDEIRI